MLTIEKLLLDTEIIHDNTYIRIFDENNKLLYQDVWYTDRLTDFLEEEIKKLIYEPEKNRCQITVKKKD